jgi:minor histocompatibility antigen H13
MATNSSNGPGPVSEMLGILAYSFAQIQPLLPLYTHLVLAALFPIFTGAYASLSRPSSAAKSTKRPKEYRASGEQDDQDDDEASLQRMEGLSPSDAIVFPLLAACTLGALYLLIKHMGATLLNKILRYYFSAMAIISLAKLINDALGVTESLFFPHYYVEGRALWQVDQSERKAIHSAICMRPSPLPGVLGRIILPQRVLGAFWVLRAILRPKYRLRLHLSKVISFKVTLNLRMILSSILALATIFCANFVSDAWWLTNLQGFAFAYSALQLMSPTTFATGSLILCALFFYDIYFVFYTPLMVTVATKLDVPIKLLFPRPLEHGQVAADRNMAMLGLGDVVIPGMMVGLALRFDLYMFYWKRQTRRLNKTPSSATVASKKAQDDDDDDMNKEPYRSVTGHWGNRFWTKSWIGRSLLPKYDPSKKRNPIPSFPKPYFYASIVGYIAGMCVTLGIMHVYKHAQPALLYLVPGVLGSLWLTALIRREVKQMWAFTEASQDDEIDEKKKMQGNEKSKDKQEEKSTFFSSWWSKSFFAAEKTERNAKILEQHFAKAIDKDDDDDDDKNSISDENGANNNTSSNSNNSNNKNDTFFQFSFTRQSPQKSSASRSRRLDVDNKTHSSSGLDERVSVAGSRVKWRGAGPQETREERAGKRRRI